MDYSLDLYTYRVSCMRAELAQREVERLREQVSRARSTSKGSGRSDEGPSEGRGERDEKDECSPSRLEAVLFSKDREILRLLENVQRLQFTLQEVQDSSANQIAELERQLAYKSEAVDSFISGHRTLPHRTLPHRTLPTGRCPQDAAPQDAAPQDAG
ncbi:hypothetical protein NFI96_003521 [Prochilodus magdalenae]|nr:hypothetical protein NFI96_003521 [Prochilodus magdalenae]